MLLIRLQFLIFSITMGANYTYEVKNSEIWVPAFFMHNNSFIATVIPCIIILGQN